MEKEISEADKRNFSRVDAFIPMSYRFVPSEEQDYIQSKIFDPIYFKGTDIFPEITDQALDTCLRIINSKLDQLLHLLTLRNEGFHSLPSRLVNISGSGIRLTTSEKFSIGDILEIKTFLSSQKHCALCIYGKIVGIEEDPEGYQTSLSFIHLDDAVRDEIIKFVFDREREILREKRGGMNYQ
jgi:hypothetical protein